MLLRFGIDPDEAREAVAKSKEEKPQVSEKDREL